MTERRFKMIHDLGSVSIACLLAAAIIVPLSGCATPSGSDVSAEADAGSIHDSDDDSAPEFTLADLSGEEFKLSDTAGQVRLIDFWATWCAPCREEIPMLQRLNDTYKDLGFSVVAISDVYADVVRKFIKEEGITYTNLIDPGEVAEDYLVLGLPTGFLLDQNGNIVERFVGPKPTSILERRIRELLELPPAT